MTGIAIKGSLPILGRPEVVLAALHDCAVLQGILPSCEGVDAVAPGRFRVRIARKIGVLTLRMEPDLVIAPGAEALRHTLSVQASSRIAGSIDATLALHLSREPLGTRLFWDGEVSASGLVRRLLTDRQDQVSAGVAGLFAALKREVEGKKA